MNEQIWWIILGLIALVVVILAVSLRKRISEDEAESDPLPKEVQELDAQAEKPLPPKAIEALPRRLSVSQALASWMPLLRERTRDRQRWEEVLILSDMGPQLTESLIQGLQKTDQEPKDYFKTSLKNILRPAKAEHEPWKSKKPWVLLVVGVNGVGKTTSVVKLGRFFKEQNLQVGVVGADTFRKAAIEQLERGCQKNNINFFSYKISEEASEGADPAAVLFDGIKKFQEMDIILVDTSGRLHTKKNLMEELKKMKRVADKALPGAPHDIWIVLDATLGQNALQQAKVFNEAVNLSGIILTKLDGLSRGGSVFELFRQLQVPIWFLGIGESSEDLERFDPENFVEELFDDKALSFLG